MASRDRSRLLRPGRRRRARRDRAGPAAAERGRLHDVFRRRALRRADRPGARSRLADSTATSTSSASERLLPLYPAYFSALDLRRYDLVVSSSSAFAKAMRTSRRHVHVAYIHAPMRFAWQFQEYERGSSAWAVRRASRAACWAPRCGRGTSARRASPTTWWPTRTPCASGSDTGGAATRRSSIRRWTWTRWRSRRANDGYLLVAARLLAYRRVDLAVDAATATGRQPDRRWRRAGTPRARGARGTQRRPSRATSRARACIELFARCAAYLVPGEEDFGIAPVEAMAAGKPVVALDRGGAARDRRRRRQWRAVR